jgi:hypothetical protein
MGDIKTKVTYKVTKEPTGKWAVIAVMNTKTDRGYETYHGSLVDRFDTRKQAREYLKKIKQKPEDELTPEEIIEQKKEPDTPPPPYRREFWIKLKEPVKLTGSFLESKCLHYDGKNEGQINDWVKEIFPKASLVVDLLPAEEGSKRITISYNAGRYIQKETLMKGDVLIYTKNEHVDGFAAWDWPSLLKHWDLIEEPGEEKMMPENEAQSLFDHLETPKYPAEAYSAKEENSDEYWLGYENGLKERIAKVEDERLLNAMELAVSNRFKELGIVPRSAAGHDCASEACKQVCKQVKAAEERIEDCMPNVPRLTTFPEHEDRIVKMAVKQALEYSKEVQLSLQKQISDLRSYVAEKISESEGRALTESATGIDRLEDKSDAISRFAHGEISRLAEYVDKQDWSLQGQIKEARELLQGYHEVIDGMRTDIQTCHKNTELVIDSIRRSANTKGKTKVQFPQIADLFKRIELIESHLNRSPHLKQDFKGWDTHLGKVYNEINDLKQHFTLRLEDVNNHHVKFSRDVRHHVENFEARLTAIHEQVVEIRSHRGKQITDAIKPLEDGLIALQQQLSEIRERVISNELKTVTKEEFRRDAEKRTEFFQNLIELRIMSLTRPTAKVALWFDRISDTRLGKFLKMQD